MRPLTPSRQANVRKVAALRVAGASWTEVAREMGTTTSAARRSYEREVGDHVVEMSRSHNRAAAGSMRELPGEVTRLLHDPDDARGVHAVLREPRRRDVIADKAACGSADPDMFVPWGNTIATEPAIAICSGCPVRGECAADSLMAPMKMHGVWGGLPSRRRNGLQQALEGAGFVFPTTKRSGEKKAA